MGETTKISWCDHTFNPWIGCMKVSPACDGCYAENLMDTRYGRVEWGAPGKGVGTRARTSPGNWAQPVRWNKVAIAEGTRPFVFCSSLADVFDNQVPSEWRADLFDLIRATPQLVWLLLTKRPQNIVRLSTDDNERWLGEEFPRNAAIGTTVEDQQRADQNIPALLRAKASLSPAFAFLSCEPLLGPIDLSLIFESAAGGEAHGSALEPAERGAHWTSPHSPPALLPMVGVDWVITGGETDQGKHKARPTNPTWFRSLRDQCDAAGVAYHHKQNGEWCEYAAVGANGWERTRDGYGRIYSGDFGTDKAFLFDGQEFPSAYPWMHGIADTGPCMVRVGKSRSGRAIDGIEHDARPEVRP